VACADCFFAFQAQGSATDVSNSYYIAPDTVYHKADGVELKVDLYLPYANLNAEAKTNRPTLIYFHGGGWMGGSKEGSSLRVLPYLEKGWAAVNVQYRLGGTALAPAARRAGHPLCSVVGDP
jgi:acetyl esterase/lipase